MDSIRSFEPVGNAHVRVLILGSMPGVASLRAGEYYAHPRNQFWRLMGALLGLDAGAPYGQRIASLNNTRIALWDVLHSCMREGSLDANIDKGSQIPNDFKSYFAQHTQITHVFFNGSAAEKIYRSAVLPGLPADSFEYLRLPSSSPANAAYSFERKLEAWRALLRVV